MTIASLIVDISANTLALQKDVGKINSTLDSVASTAQKVAGALGIAFSATAIVSGVQRLISTTLDYADTLSNLSVATSISVEGLQRLEAIGVTAGVSMDTMASAVEKLHKNLDDPKAIAAVEAMGLNYERIRNMQPEDQFLEIAKAVGEIEDPIERANAGAALFGKTWDQISPAITKDVDDIVATFQGMTREEVEALDKAGDAWDRWAHTVSLKVRAAMGEIVMLYDMEKSRRPLDVLFSDVAMPALPKAPTGPSRGPVLPTLGPAEMKGAIRDLDDLAKSTAKHTEALGKQTEAMRAFGQIVRQDIEGNQFAWQRQLELQQFMIDQLPVLESRIYAFGAAAGPVADAIIPAMAASTYRATQEFKGLEGAVTVANGVMITDLPDWQTQLGDLSKAFVDLSQVADGALSGITRGIGTVTSGFVLADKGIDSFKGGLASLKNGDLLSGITGIASGIGGIVGAATAAIGAIKGLISLAKGGEQGTIVNPARDAWFAAHGGLAGVNEAAFAATGGLDLTEAIFGAKTKSSFEEATGAWERATGEQASFAAGTGGRFLDFGAGTPVTLHGRERVMTEAEGRRMDTRTDPAMLDLLSSRLSNIETLLQRQPRALSLALKTALLQAS